jgi:hypothetical protein
MAYRLLSNIQVTHCPLSPLDDVSYILLPGEVLEVGRPPHVRKVGLNRSVAVATVITTAFFLRVRLLTTLEWNTDQRSWSSLQKINEGEYRASEAGAQQSRRRRADPADGSAYESVPVSMAAAGPLRAGGDSRAPL